jgi:hypothetical protein
MRAVQWLRTRLAVIGRSHAAQDVALGVVASAAGVWVLVQVFPGVPLQAGSVDLRVTVVPALTGGLTVEAPPLGNLSADSFTAPARVVAHVESIDVGAVDGILRGTAPPSVGTPDAAQLSRVIGLALALDAGAAAAFGIVLAVALRLGRSRAARVSLSAAATVVLVGFVGLLTQDTAAYAQPERTGAWAALPELSPVSLAEGRIGGDLGAQLTRFGQNLTGFYAALTADARAAGLRDDSRVVLVVPDGLPATARASAVAWFEPDAVVPPEELQPTAEVTSTPDGLVLPDGSTAPLTPGTADEVSPSRFAVLYLDPDSGALRAVDLVTVDGAGATLERRTVTPAAAP